MPIGSSQQAVSYTNLKLSPLHFPGLLSLLGTGKQAKTSFFDLDYFVPKTSQVVTKYVQQRKHARNVTDNVTAWLVDMY